jgi:hypothetical protein
MQLTGFGEILGEGNAEKGGCTLRQTIAWMTRKQWRNWRKKESGCGQDEKTTVTKLAEERTGAPCDG